MSEGIPPQFVVDVAEHEDLAISIEEGGVAHVTKSTPDSDSSIAFDVVGSLAHSHGLVIVGGVAFYGDDGHDARVVVKVADEGWQTGGGSE